MTSGQSPPEPASTPAGKPRPKFLMLWDDKGFPKLLALIVEKSFEVVPVHSREAALEALAKDSFSAVLLNIISFIPGGGMEFVEELHRYGNPIPVIILTAALRKSEFADIVYDLQDIRCPPTVFAVVPQPASLETLLTVFQAVSRHRVRKRSPGAATDGAPPS
jgi:DNA-binding NtrC family response regulator